VILLALVFKRWPFLLLMCRELLSGFKHENLTQSDVCDSNVPRDAHIYVVVVAHKPKLVKFLTHIALY
jgi:hypothetical protein